MTAGRCYVLQLTEDLNELRLACDTCATEFTLPVGEVIECPVCSAILNAPEPKTCPHCGGTAVLEVEWMGEKGARRQVFRAICQRCGCRTRACNYADDAAISWNDRVEGSL